MRLRAYQSNSNTLLIRRGSILRNVVTLLLLVAIIGGIAWVVQNLPTKEVPKKDDVPRPPSDRPSLIFARSVAQWYPPKTAKKKKQDEEPSPADQFPYKDFEQGTNGHYDFLFKNATETDIEIVFYTTDCDCNSVQASTLPGDEVERLAKLHNEKPGEPIPYAKQPELKTLSRDVNKDSAVLVKVGEGGVVRVNFNAKKSPGQELRVRPTILYQPVGQPVRRQGQGLLVPVMVRQPVNFQPSRVSVGVLGANATTQGKLIAWSSTRSDLKLELGNNKDPLFQVNIQPLAKEEYASLEETLDNERNTATVRSAVHVTVTVRESAGGKQLDLGSFYRKLPVSLDGILNPDIQGPEIVGRVEGNLMIGGTDDQGRVRFKSFDADNGGKKAVEIAADEKAELKTYSHQPPWVEVSLKLDKKTTPPPNRRIWILEARVPADTPGVRSFDEPDAIVLQVTTGKSVRLVRIPLEGHIGGR